eukprot:Skav219204  [mRNA]  locus=scaffold537:82758:86567:+ [translate_table: standard]
MPMGDQLGILDMYGFENLETNQLEQTLSCIETLAAWHSLASHSFSVDRGRCFLTAKVSKGHRAELNSLLANLKNMHGLHFIRCYRPNKDGRRACTAGRAGEQSSAWVDRSFLAKQLRGSGVLQLLQVMGQGFPHRIALKEELSENPQPVDPLRIAAARRTARRLHWRRALHAVTLAAFLVCIFVFRLQRMRIKRGLTVRSEKKANKHVAIVEERMLEEKLEESTRPKMNASMEGMELNLSKAGHKRSRPPATPQEGGILLEMLRKRRLC